MGMVLSAFYVLVNLSVPPVNCMLLEDYCISVIFDFAMPRWFPSHRRHLVNVCGMHEVIHPEKMDHKCIADEPEEFLNLFQKPG